MIKNDRQDIYKMVSETEMFTPAEVEVAMELVDIFLNDVHQKDYWLAVAEYEDYQVIGYVCYGPTPATDGTFDLYWIVVSPEFQNKGVGKQLLNYVETQIFQRGGRLIIIETSSQEKYLPTRHFYLKNNYQIAAQINDFYRPGDDRVIYIKYFNSQK
jgi:ribosomal protein S18 acetylase RimI-like enzyme